MGKLENIDPVWILMATCLIENHTFLQPRPKNTKRLPRTIPTNEIFPRYARLSPGVARTFSLFHLDLGIEYGVPGNGFLGNESAIQKQQKSPEQYFREIQII